MIRTNRILLAVPDAEVRADLECPLREAGFEVVLGSGAPAAFEDFDENGYVMVVLGGQDAQNSFEACQVIREKSCIPVLIVIVAGQEQAILAGLDAGATDFVVAPVRPTELIARVRAMLHRTSAPLSLPGWVVQYRNLMLDMRARRLTKNGCVVPLPRTEMRLLHFFMRHPGETLSKDTLLRNVWDHQTISGDYNLVDTAIKRLRHHIEDDPRQPAFIVTVWGVGFRFGE